MACVHVKMPVAECLERLLVKFDNFNQHRTQLWKLLKWEAERLANFLRENESFHGHVIEITSSTSIDIDVICKQLGAMKIESMESNVGT